MSERFASDLLFIIIVLLVAAVLGFLIGYFIRKPKTIIKFVPEPVREGSPEEEKDAEEEVPEKQITDEGIPEFDPETARALLGRKIAQDDLKIVEGIGPVIEGILRKSGIDTWEKLAGSDAENIRSVLATEGQRFRVHDPGTWPQQAGLAFKGKWEELRQLQDGLLGGRARG